MIYFTGDTHFGHRLMTREEEGGIGLRPFDTLDQMHEYMITAWNMQVRPGDIVYHVGDYAFMHPDEGMKIRDQLNGNIYMLRGNHCGCESAMEKMGAWGWLKDIYYLKTKLADEDLHIVLCHYPIESWMNRQHGAVHLHGHTHGNLLRKDPRRMDVGWDSWDRPVSILEVYQRLADAELTVVDGHSPEDKK